MPNQLDPAYRPYWNAIRANVCAVCLDQANDGSCGLGGRSCAIERHLPRLVEVLGAVKSNRMDEFVEAVEREVCSQCQEQGAAGRCGLRDAGTCALYAYLPLVLEAMEDVAEGRAQ